MKRTFDRTFGEDFLEGVPMEPGVYRFLDADGELLYVGKAKDLRRRLSQYRNARRGKSHRKMRRIVRESDTITWEQTESEEAALLLENELIRTLRPPLNVVGAYSFLYPIIGLKRDARFLHVVFSTQEEALAERGFQRFGCYRNRRVSRKGFDALEQLLTWLGHLEGAPEQLPYTVWRPFRQIPEDLDDDLAALLIGDSRAFLERIILALLDKPVARREASEVQSALKTLRRFYTREGARLAQLREALGVDYVPQSERDQAMIALEFADED